MTNPSIAESYLEAARIINQAALDVVFVDVIWDKLYRVRKYLNEQAANVLSAALKDEAVL